jgi:hypothetical protein
MEENYYKSKQINNYFFKSNPVCILKEVTFTINLSNTIVNKFIVKSEKLKYTHIFS